MTTTVTIKDSNYNAWHMRATGGSGGSSGREKRVPLGNCDIIVLFISNLAIIFNKMLLLILLIASAKVEAEGLICGCGDILTKENLGGCCIGLLDFNRGTCTSIVCTICFAGKFNCPFCIIKDEEMKWKIVDKRGKSHKFVLETTSPTNTPQTARTTEEKSSGGSIKFKRSKRKSTPSADVDRLITGNNN